VDLTTGSTVFFKADRLGAMLGLVGLFLFSECRLYHSETFES
jgi:hypothetical protein